MLISRECYEDRFEKLINLSNYIRNNLIKVHSITAIKPRKEAIAIQYKCTIISTHVLLGMKILSSSPYATFNSKEWNSLVSKNDKFANTPIKVQKKHFRTFTFQKIQESRVQQKKSVLHKQMQIIFAQKNFN